MLGGPFQLVARSLILISRDGVHVYASIRFSNTQALYECRRARALEDSGATEPTGEEPKQYFNRQRLDDVTPAIVPRRSSNGEAISRV